MPVTRHHRLDRSLREPQWWIRIATLLIVLVGGAILIFTYSRAEARRERAMERVEVGDTAPRVTALLGEPAAICGGAALDHLRNRFSPDWPAAALDRAIELLEEQTGERWIYPLDAADRAGCGAPLRGTEIGFDSTRRVLWYVPLIGRRPLELPPAFSPAVLNQESTEPDA